MPRIEESVDIAASPVDIFKLCHDVARRPEWDERVVHIELLTSGPIRQGALLRIDAASGGEFAFTWDAECSEFHFPTASEFTVLDAAPSSPFHAGTESWQFSSVGAPTSSDSVSTRLTLAWEYELEGLGARVLDLLLRRAATRRAIQRSLANLKRIVETA